MGRGFTRGRFTVDMPDDFVVSWIGMRLNHGNLPGFGLAPVGDH